MSCQHTDSVTLKRQYTTIITILSLPQWHSVNVILATIILYCLLHVCASIPFMCIKAVYTSVYCIQYIFSVYKLTWYVQYRTKCPMYHSKVCTSCRANNSSLTNTRASLSRLPQLDFHFTKNYRVVITFSRKTCSIILSGVIKYINCINIQAIKLKLN